MITRNAMQLKAFIKKMATDFDYARDISFEDACNSIRELMRRVTV